MSTGLGNDTVESRVLRVVTEVLALEEPPPDLDVSISRELAVDSLDQLSLFMALEDEFGARIRTQDAEGIDTLREIIDYVHQRLIVARAG